MDPKKQAMGYLIFQFLYRIKELFYHWYVKSSRIYWHWTFNKLEDVDKVFAFKTTIKHWLEPLYGDYSVIGYILGFMFRTSRIIIGGIIHALIMILALIIYIIWLALPIFATYRIITG